MELYKDKESEVFFHAFRYSHIIRYLEKSVKSRKNLLFALKINRKSLS